MRILVLHSRYLSGAVSGENRVVQDEVELLRKAGHQVCLWAPSPADVGGVRLLGLGASAVWSGRAVAALRDLVRRHRPEVVHCHNLFPMLSPAVVRAAAEKAAVVVTLHNYRLLCLPANLLREGTVCEACLGRLPWRGVRYRCYRGSALASGALAASLALHRRLGTFDQVKLYLAVSRFVRDKHLEAGFPPERVWIKPNFVWNASPRPGPGEYFLFLGRFSPEKDLDTLLEVWRSARGRLLLAGDGPDAARLRRTGPARVEFLPAQPPEEAAKLLARARALLLPSLSYEGAPRSLLEAYAAGVPVLANDIGALPELVEEGVSGLTLQPRDRDRWAAAIQRLEDDDECVRLGEGALRLWHERYSPERGLQELEVAYARSLGQESASAPLEL
jgi:glycosyltransferase involved in cell wall biosynthesis